MQLSEISTRYRNILEHCREMALRHVREDQISGMILAINERQTELDCYITEIETKNKDCSDSEIFTLFARLSAFIAGIFSLFPSNIDKDGKDFNSPWYHVHTYLFDEIEKVPRSYVTRDILAALEVARGEICEVYRLQRLQNEPSRIPEECSLFFEALEIASNFIAEHLRLLPAKNKYEKSEEHSSMIRSKYSGGEERYPIDIRSCVQNDIQRYFRGTSVKISDRIFQVVRGTYSDSISQLVPEDNELLSSLLLTYPSLAFALRVADFKPEKLLNDKISFTKTDTPSWGYAWTVSLRRWFLSDDGQPTNVAKRILDTNRFGPFELIDGILDSMSRPWGHAIQSEFIRKLQNASESFANEDISLNEVISKIQEQSRIAQTIDPSFARQQLGLYMDNTNKVRVIQFASYCMDGLYDFNEESQEYGIVRGNIVQGVGPLIDEQINEFEWLIEKDLPEAKFQAFLEKNPFLLSALGSYSRIVPHVILHEEDSIDKIPDFFLEYADRRGTDILELKPPKVRLDVRVTNRDKFNHIVHRAVAQLKTYRDWFDTEANRRYFSQKTGMKCFRPRAIIVIGRSRDFQSHIDRLRFEDTIPEWVTLYTYDDLLSFCMKRACFFSADLVLCL